MSKKRSVEVAVVSDVHLGTYGCHAKELLHYLKSIKPDVLVLNGDIVNIWQFSKRYWPAAHMCIVKQIFGMAAKGVTIYYVTGNHDEMLRKFEGFTMGSLQVVNKVVLPLATGKAWIFHGDVFDITMKHSKWLAKLGAVGYDTLILLNAVVNFIYEKLGRGRVSFSKKIKNRVKSAVKFIDDFEEYRRRDRDQQPVRLRGVRAHPQPRNPQNHYRAGAGDVPQQRRLGREPHGAGVQPRTVGAVSVPG